MALWLDGEGEEGAADQPVAGSFTVVPSSRAPVIPYFFGLHSRASFCASAISGIGGKAIARQTTTAARAKSD